MSTAEQVLVLSLMTAAVVLILGLALAALAIWIVEYLPAHLRLLKRRLKQFRSRVVTI